MDVSALQQKLADAGSSVNVDGSFGPRTLAAILDYTTQRKLADLGLQLASGMLIHFPTYQITLGLRQAHFLAQAAHETGAFRYLTELGGASYFSKYNGRQDLGNTQPGDGLLYRGRGLFQITGRLNYDHYGKRLGLDLISNPSLVAQPDTAVATACVYWADHGLNQLADADDVKGITHKINGGYNGLDERVAYLDRLKSLLL